jgi:asparagine synthase (glutamine-hydrolysing)
MYGIAAVLNLSLRPVAHLRPAVSAMNGLLRHRGPAREGTWHHPRGMARFAHRRLSIINLATGQQPMSDEGGNWITYNGKVYNYVELRAEPGAAAQFVTTSDTEVILRACRRWGEDCLSHLRGMFAFALWDEGRQTLFCARGRFGIKPLYYTVVDGVLYLASEVKALLPFLPQAETDLEGFKDYLTFQFCLTSPTSSSASRRPSAARSTPATSSSPTSRSSPTWARSGSTSRCSRSSGARGFSRIWTGDTSV